jgi:hypothetical protein
MGRQSSILVDPFSSFAQEMRFLDIVGIHLSVRHTVHTLKSDESWQTGLILPTDSQSGNVHRGQKVWHTGGTQCVARTSDKVSLTGKPSI